MDPAYSRSDSLPDTDCAIASNEKGDILIMWISNSQNFLYAVHESVYGWDLPAVLLPRDGKNEELTVVYAETLGVIIAVYSSTSTVRNSGNGLCPFFLPSPRSPNVNSITFFYRFRHPFHVEG